jgi:hypothetical protein
MFRTIIKVGLLGWICLGFIGSLAAQEDLKVQLAFPSLNEWVNIRDVAISADQKEVYFTVQSAFSELSQIAWMSQSAGEFSDPQLMPFSDRFIDMEPFLSYDQKVLYFASNRPLDSSGEAKDFDIWCVKRKEIGAPWSEPIHLGPMVNSENDEFYPSLSINNNLYFTMSAPTGLGNDDIYFCAYEDGEYAKPVLLDTTVNTPGFEFNAFISKNEDFLIYTRHNSPDGYGSGDLYISRRLENGRWGQSQNLGEQINTSFMEYCPFYDEEQGVLYFTSRRKNTQLLKFENIEAYKNYIFGSDNGLSKLYKIQIKLHEK